VDVLNAALSLQQYPGRDGTPGLEIARDELFAYGTFDKNPEF
jgi:hypothetical protein